MLGSKRYSDMGWQQTDSDLLDLFLDPTCVSLPQWLTQLVATSILTALLAIAVHRSRMHLLAQVQAQVLRSELARYVSPDVADALAQRPSGGFGAPTPRDWPCCSPTSSASPASTSASRPSGPSRCSEVFGRGVRRWCSAIRERWTNTSLRHEPAPSS